MKGFEMVAALKGIVNRTSLNTLTPQDKAKIRRLLEIIILYLYSLQKFGQAARVSCSILNDNDSD